MKVGGVGNYENVHVLCLNQQNCAQSGYHLFPALKQNLDGHKFKNDRETRKVLTRFTITQDTLLPAGKGNFCLMIRQIPHLCRWLCGEVVA